MAEYKEKYKIGFYDSHDNYYEVWIKKRNYLGVATYVNAGSIACKIDMIGKGDDLMETIKGQKLVLQLIAETDYKFEEFFTANDRDYLIELYPDQDTAVAKLSITAADTGSTADPSVAAEFTTYATDTIELPKATFKIVSKPTSTNPLFNTLTAAVRLYWNFEASGRTYKIIISEYSVSVSDSIDDVAQGLIDNISNSDFTGAVTGSGTGEGTITAKWWRGSTGNLIRNTKLLVEPATILIKVESGIFDLGQEPAGFIIRIGSQRSKVYEGTTIYWRDYVSPTFYAQAGETINELCDRICAEIDGTPAGVYDWWFQDSNGVWIGDDIISRFEIILPPWILRATHNGTGTITFTLEAGGADYNNESLNMNSTSGGFNETGDFYMNYPSGSSLFAGGTSNGVSYTIQIDTGLGFTNLVTYTKTAGDELIDIIIAIKNLINSTTTYTAEIAANDPRTIILYPPTGETGIGWKTKWIFTGTATGVAEDFTTVNTQIIVWRGWVIPNLYVEPYEGEPYPVQLTATDGLGDLKSEDFVDAFGNEIEGDITLLQAIIICLSKTGLKLKIADGINIYEDSFDSSSDKSPLEQTYIDALLLRNKNCAEILTTILSQFLARVYQYNGCWVIQRIPEAIATSNRRIYDKNGVYESVAAIHNEIVLSGSTGNSPMIAGEGSLETEQAYKEIRTKYIYGLKIQLLKNSSFDNGLDGVWNTSSAAKLLFNGELYGHPSVLQDLGDAYNDTSVNPTGARAYIYQTFELEKDTEHTYRITGKYGFFDESVWNVTPNEFSKIMIKLTGATNTYYANPDGSWTTTETFGVLPYVNKQWQTFDILLESLPEDGTIEYRIYLMHLSQSMANVWVGWDYATFSVIGNFSEGEYAAMRYSESYKLYNTVRELEIYAADVPNVKSRNTIYSMMLKNSGGDGLISWESGKTLASIARYELFKQYGTYGQRLSATLHSEEYNFDSTIKDTLNSDKLFMLNGATWYITESRIAGEFIQINKALLSETIEEIFLPLEEQKQGDETYNPASGGNSTSVVATIPADVLRESDIVDNLLSNSPLSVLSSNQGRELKALIDALTVLLNDPYTALTASASVTWDTSTGLNKTLTRGADFTLTLTNFTNGMSGDVRLNITAETTITLAATGVTFKGNGSITDLATGIYHLAWVCTSSTTIEYNIALYE